MHEISYSPTIDEFQQVLRIVDRAFPGVPDVPVPAWQRHLFRSLRRLVTSGPIWICVALMVLLMVSDLEIRMWHVLLVAVSACAAGASACWAAQDKTAMRCIRAHVERPGTSTIRLTNEGVEAQRGATRSLTPWNAYSRIAIVDTFIFLFHDCTADFIPLAAFTNEEQMDEFAKFAAEKIAEHGHAS